MAVACWLAVCARRSATPFLLQTLRACFYQALCGVLDQRRCKIQPLASDRYPGTDSLRREVPMAASPGALTGGPAGKISLDHRMMRKLCLKTRGTGGTKAGRASPRKKEQHEQDNEDQLWALSYMAQLGPPGDGTLRKKGGLQEEEGCPIRLVAGAPPPPASCNCCLTQPGAGAAPPGSSLPPCTQESLSFAKS